MESNLSAHRDRGKEHRQPRARPLRLRRLLPVPRRHDRRRPRPDRPRPEGVHRGLRRPIQGKDEGPLRRGPPRVPQARGQPEVDRGHAAPRLQGRLRALRHRGLPLRLRRHRRRRRGLDVPRRNQKVRPGRGGTGLHAGVQPLGPARHLASGCSRRPSAACGPSPTPKTSKLSNRLTWRTRDAGGAT